MIDDLDKNNGNLRELLDNVRDNEEKLSFYKHELSGSNKCLVDWFTKQDYFPEFLVYEISKNTYSSRKVDYDTVKDIIYKGRYVFSKFRITKSDSMSIDIKYFDRDKNDYQILSTEYFPCSSLTKMQEIIEKSEDNSLIDSVIHRKMSRIKNYQATISDYESEIKTVENSIKHEEEDIEHMKTWRK